MRGFIRVLCIRLGRGRYPGASPDLVGANTSNWDFWGWRFMYGESAPQLKAIGHHLEGMAPSSCPVERSFSLPESIHSLARTILTHDKVSNLLFIHTNVKFLVATTPTTSISSFFKSIVTDSDHDDDVSSGDEGSEADKQTG